MASLSLLSACAKKNNKQVAVEMTNVIIEEVATYPDWKGWLSEFERTVDSQKAALERVKENPKHFLMKRVMYSNQNAQFRGEALEMMTSLSNPDLLEFNKTYQSIADRAHKQIQ